jgi:hypothetical protein
VIALPLGLSETTQFISMLYPRHDALRCDERHPTASTESDAGIVTM